MLWLALSCVLGYQQDGELTTLSIEQTRSAHYFYYDKALQSSVKSMHMDDSNIAFFKKKVSNMEKEMLDIKKHILKVQTFAMETNLQCLELKKKVLIASESTNEEQMEASGHIADILTNTETEMDTEMETNEIVVE